MIAGLEGEKCDLKPRNVSSSPSPIVVTHCSASKFSLFKSLSFLELSLFSPKIGLDVNDLI
jgi:hypothetical protein